MLKTGMKNSTSPDDHSYFPKYLSDVLLKMWRHHPHVKQGVVMFVDKTNDLEEFKNNIYKTPGKFRKMLNKHCWPVIRCPLGCWQFIDKCRTLQFHHFISRHLDIKIPSAKKELSASFRKDWPETSMNSFKWCVKPSLCISKDEGLCVLLCVDVMTTDVVL